MEMLNAMQVKDEIGFWSSSENYDTARTVLVAVCDSNL